MFFVVVVAGVLLVLLLQLQLLLPPPPPRVFLCIAHVVAAAAAAAAASTAVEGIDRSCGFAHVYRFHYRIVEHFPPAPRDFLPGGRRKLPQSSAFFGLLKACL